MKVLRLSFILSIAALMTCAVGISAQTASDHWGETPRLMVEGNHLVNTYGEQVMLHGVMDTPSPYFSGYRFTDGKWINVYNDGDNYIAKCISYFDKLFTAVTDTKQGSWCNVFRLHLDPCWTDNPNKVYASGFTTSGDKTRDPNGNEVSGESNIMHFDLSRLEKYLNNLYLPIARKAQGHGLYVIVRPPGVCPNTIKVGDYYQKYLIDVWDAVTKNEDVLKNSDWLSIELANEPINITEQNGQKLTTTKRDFFQPIVDRIRANGFKGIIWIPGETWQQDYKSYAEQPVLDGTMGDKPQIGYAVHFYPGWFSTSDKAHDAKTSIRSFLGSVPVAKTHPIMITEVDWSPEDPTQPSKKNEWGEEVRGNYGTWGTGSTSKFGQAFKAVIDHLGNAGMTLTHTHDYMDIDHYLATGELRPAFTGKLADTYEACSGACFKWYDEYAHSVIAANTWENTDAFYFDAVDEVKNAAASLDGKTYAVSNKSLTHFWNVSTSYGNPQDIHSNEMADWEETEFNYLHFTRVTDSGCSTQGNIYAVQMSKENGQPYSLWGSNGYLNAQPNGNVLFALGLNGKQYGQDEQYCGLWKIDYAEDEGAYTFCNVGRLEKGLGAYVTPSSTSPSEAKSFVRIFSKVSMKNPNGIDAVHSDTAGNPASSVFSIDGRCFNTLQKGINIVRMADGSTRKIVVR